MSLGERNLLWAHGSDDTSGIHDLPLALTEPRPPFVEHVAVVFADGVAHLLSDLNDEQHAAVTYGEGPLLVVAGAGTGKTQVITRRVAWLIAEQRALPEEILALTFTDRAAEEMQARVDRLVPYGYATTPIKTFHAWGDELLREMAREAEFSVAVSDFSRDLMARTCPESAGRILRIYNGIDETIGHTDRKSVV